VNGPALPHRDESGVEVEPSLLNQGFAELLFPERGEPPEALQAISRPPGIKNSSPLAPPASLSSVPALARSIWVSRNPSTIRPSSPSSRATSTAWRRGTGQGHLQQEELPMGAIPPERPCQGEGVRAPPGGQEIHHGLDLPLSNSSEGWIIEAGVGRGAGRSAREIPPGDASEDRLEGPPVLKGQDRLEERSDPLPAEKPVDLDEVVHERIRSPALRPGEDRSPSPGESQPPLRNRSFSSSQA